MDIKVILLNSLSSSSLKPLFPHFSYSDHHWVLNIHGIHPHLSISIPVDGASFISQLDDLVWLVPYLQLGPYPPLPSTNTRVIFSECKFDWFTTFPLPSNHSNVFPLLWGWISDPQHVCKALHDWVLHTSPASPWTMTLPASLPFTKHTAVTPCFLLPQGLWTYSCHCQGSSYLSLHLIKFHPFFRFHLSHRLLRKASLIF